MRMIRYKMYIGVIYFGKRTTNEYKNLVHRSLWKLFKYKIFYSEILYLLIYYITRDCIFFYYIDAWLYRLWNKVVNYDICYVHCAILSSRFTRSRHDPSNLFATLIAIVFLSGSRDCGPLHVFALCIVMLFAPVTFLRMSLYISRGSFIKARRERGEQQQAYFFFLSHFLQTKFCETRKNHAICFIAGWTRNSESFIKIKELFAVIVPLVPFYFYSLSFLFHNDTSDKSVKLP